jgi:hypothetical protein
LQLEESHKPIEHYQTLQNAAHALLQRLDELYQETGKPFVSKPFKLLVYFDEAHRLQMSSKSNNAYDSLMNAISSINGRSIFFVFLSTDPRIRSFNSINVDYDIEDKRDLTQPFFELPFDTFSRNFWSEVKAADKMTLAGVCELEQMTKFGRPM